MTFGDFSTLFLFSFRSRGICAAIMDKEAAPRNKMTSEDAKRIQSSQDKKEARGEKSDQGFKARAMAAGDKNEKETAPKNNMTAEETAPKNNMTAEDARRIQACQDKKEARGEECDQKFKARAMAAADKNEKGSKQEK